LHAWTFWFNHEPIQIWMLVSTSFYASISKNYGECKMGLMNSGFNNIQSEWFDSYANVNMLKDAKRSLTHSSINVKH
jgi:hypothetical protein